MLYILIGLVTCLKQCAIKQTCALDALENIL